jgi:methylated-DNA-[protein]-cysteine S-methyltransferase
VNDVSWAELITPVGPVSVGCTEDGLARVRFGPPPERGTPGSGPPARAQADGARQQLAEYFGGSRCAFGLPVDWPTALGGRTAAAGVRQRVLRVLMETVGHGETVTYGALAERAEVPGDGQVPPARVVGQIMASNPCPLVMPCHRVLAGDGLGGFSGGTGVEVKRWLLTFEGSLPPTLDWDPAGMGVSLAMGWPAR